MKTIVVFSGAGLSAESGIPTFRDANGLWENHRIEDVATPEGWKKDPSLVLSFYAKRFETQRHCHPNPAHRAIASLQEKYSVLNITQNIDSLLERAGCSSVIHLHGSIELQICERHHSRSYFPGDEHQCDYRSMIDRPISPGDTCPKCGNHLRPDVVWFGEPVNMQEGRVREIYSTIVAFIGIGTSAQVYPAAGFLQYFASIKRKYFIDPFPAYDVLSGYHVIQGTAAIQMPLLATELLSLPL